MPQELPRAARKAVHERSLTVLSEVGMAVEHDRVRAALDDAGAAVDGTTVTVPPDLVESALDEVPESFTWHARNPDRTVTVGGPDEDPVVTPGSGARHVLRRSSGRARATMADFEEFVRLAHATATLECVGYDLCSPERFALPGNPGGFDDVDPGYELLETLLTYSDKPLVGSARTAANARASIEMATLAVGDETPSRPVVLGRVHPRSPRRWNEPIVDGLVAFAEAGQPLVISSGAIAGASAPKSLAETVVLANAETLFGVTLAQVVNPGTPVVVGYASTRYDPDAETVAYGGPTSNLLSSVGVGMGAHYGVPTRIDGGVTDAKTLGDQAGSESMGKLAAAFDGGADVVFNATGLLDTYETISPEKFVLDLDRIEGLQSAAQARDAVAERLVETDVSLDRIRAAAPGEVFVDDREPASIPDAASFRSETAVRGRYDDWEVDGARSDLDRASERVGDLLDAYERPPIDDDVREELRAYVERHG